MLAARLVLAAAAALVAMAELAGFAELAARVARADFVASAAAALVAGAAIASAIAPAAGAIAVRANWARTVPAEQWLALQSAASPAARQLLAHRPVFALIFLPQCQQQQLREWRHKAGSNRGGPADWDPPAARAYAHNQGV